MGQRPECRLPSATSGVGGKSHAGAGVDFSGKNLFEEILHSDPGTPICLLVIDRRRWHILWHQPVGERVERIAVGDAK
jgi:hypothetical protein